MSFEALLITVGVGLLLLGLIGQIKTKIFEAGVQKTSVRITVGIIGILFITAAFSFKLFPFFLNKEKPKKNSLEEYGKITVDVRPIQTEGENEDITWVKNTVERKLIEVLHNSGHIVKSAITELKNDITPNYVLTGQAYRQHEQIAIDVYLSDQNGRIITQGHLDGDFAFFKNIRSVIDEVMLYALQINRDTLEYEILRKRPTESTRAYAYYLLAKEAIRKDQLENAIERLNEAHKIDFKFAMACWTIAQIYNEIGNNDKAKFWNNKATEIDPDHPKWSYLDPRKEIKPLPKILETSRKTPFEKVELGLKYKLVDVPSYNLKLAIWLIDPTKYNANIVMQNKPLGNYIGDFVSDGSCRIAINGGFFEMDYEHRLSPSGLVINDGRIIHRLTQNGGSGIFSINNNRPRIDWAKNIKAPYIFELALQCGPILVEPGRKLGIFSNDYNRLNRSAVGISSGNVVIAYVEGKDGKGLSLYEFAKFLLADASDGGAGCDTALNLDGGSSTQAIFQCNKKILQVTGLWAVNNAIVFEKKAN